MLRPFYREQEQFWLFWCFFSSFIFSLLVYVSLIIHPFFFPSSHHSLIGVAKVYVGLSVRLTVRDGRTGLWVTESSCVVDGVFVCQRVQECTHSRVLVCAVPLCRRRVHARPVLCQFDGGVALLSPV